MCQSWKIKPGLFGGFFIVSGGPGSGVPGIRCAWDQMGSWDQVDLDQMGSWDQVDLDQMGSWDQVDLDQMGSWDQVGLRSDGIMGSGGPGSDGIMGSGGPEIRWDHGIRWA